VTRRPCLLTNAGSKGCDFGRSAAVSIRSDDAQGNPISTAPHDASATTGSALRVDGGVVRAIP
jgi:hypothetical protein